jgi:hypothetical protein
VFGRMLNVLPIRCYASSGRNQLEMQACLPYL